MEKLTKGEELNETFKTSFNMIVREMNILYQNMMAILNKKEEIKEDKKEDIKAV